jgi:glycosyltransferase involved in cell wall biosynthesis
MIVTASASGDQPRVAIVTIALNPGPSIERTIQSIMSQTYEAIDWVVVDGGSTDGSLERYGRAASRISRMVSEPDSGISEAMNKGLALATGDAVIYINGGDAFAANSAVEAIVDKWDRVNYQWATGDTEFCSESGRPMYVRRTQLGDPTKLVDRGCRIQHLSTIVARQTLIDNGGFDTSFRIAMDYELWLRLIGNGVLPQILGFSVGRFFLGGSSSNLLPRYKEDRRARQVHGMGSPWLEAELASIAWAKNTLSPLRRFGGAYRLKEWLRV